ncbi:MAG: tetratricopeptide repeat protein [Microscillaceae bacterium]|nr:tetratricopeptide repeat protein [Microscillaceae bacterium]MDW8460428.1 tetratricopeptide repeat protein [Cytophagales bacterium]
MSCVTLVLSTFFILTSCIAYSQTAEWWLEKAEEQAQKADKPNLVQAAIKLYDNALERNPLLLKAYIGRARAKLRLRDKEGALLDFSQAIKINPSFAEAYLERGLIKLSLLQYKEAAADFTQALQLQPTLYDTYLPLAQVYEAEGNFALANSFYQKAYEHFPKKLDVLDKYANFTQNKIKDHAKTIELMNQLIAQVKDEPSFYIRRGTAYHAAQILDKAIADYTQVTKLFPTDGTAFYYRGLAFSNQGKFDLACADMKKAFELGFEPAKTLLDKHCTK